MLWSLRLPSLAILTLIFPAIANSQEPWSGNRDNDYDPELDKFYNPATIRKHNPPPDPVITFTQREDRAERWSRADDAAPSDFERYSNVATAESKSNAQFVDWNDVHSGKPQSFPAGGNRPGSGNLLLLDELNGPIQADSRQIPPAPRDSVLVGRGFQTEPQYTYDGNFPPPHVSDPDFTGMGTTGYEYNAGSYGYPQDNSLATGGGVMVGGNEEYSNGFTGSQAVQKFQPIHEVEPPHFTAQGGYDELRTPVLGDSSRVVSTVDRDQRPHTDSFYQSRETLRNLEVHDQNDAHSPPSDYRNFGPPPRPQQNVRNLRARLNQQQPARFSPRTDQSFGSSNTGEFQVTDEQRLPERPDTRILLRPHRERDFGSPGPLTRDSNDQLVPYMTGQNYQGAGTQNMVQSFPEYFPNTVYPRRRSGGGVAGGRRKGALPSQTMQQYRKDREHFDFPPTFGAPQIGLESGYDGPWQEPMRRPQRYDDSEERFNNFQDQPSGDGSSYPGDELPPRPFPVKQRSGTEDDGSIDPAIALMLAGDTNAFAMSNIFNPNPRAPRRPPLDQRLNWQGGGSSQDSEALDNGPRRRPSVQSRAQVHQRRTPSKTVLEPALPTSDFDRRFPVLSTGRRDGTQRGGVSSQFGRVRPSTTLTTEPGYVPVGKLRRFLYETSKLSGSSHEDSTKGVASTDGDKVEPGYGPPSSEDSNDLDKSVNLSESG